MTHFSVYQAEQQRNTHPAGRRPCRKYAAGFTMVELVAVVAILLIVGAIAILSLGKLRLDLRQRELDSKAELIYAAAQHRMAELRAAGCEGLYQDGSQGVEPMEFPPADADEDSQDLAFFYILANDAGGRDSVAAAAVLPDSAVDAELWGGYWCIEYAPDSGSVYAVFYSASPLPDTGKLDDYRSFKYRRRMGATVGYYGGDVAMTQQTGVLQPSITIENAEKLTATFYCNRPSDQPISLQLRLSDGVNEYTRTVSQSQLYQLGSRLYRYTWVLDDLTRESTRFYAQTGGKLLCGVPITVTLTAVSDDPLVDQVSVSAVTNGLFDDRTDYQTGSGTALIACGRHLQNLDAASHVTSSITSAMQISDISFADDAADDKDWYSYYGPSFTPITNSNLTSYTGLSRLPESDAVRSSIYGLYVSSSAKLADVGLFSTFSGEISSVTLTGVRAASTTGSAGALVGRTTGAVTLTDCAVYLNARRGDLTGLSAAEPSAVPARVTGTQAGGLIGRSAGALTIRSSFAALPLSGVSSAGGLVGYASGHVTVSGSYADCYITAPFTGGLVGDSGFDARITLQNCYAAGYQTASQRAAGLAGGTVDRGEASYSACSFYGSGDVYSTAVDLAGPAATIINYVFYLRSDLSDSYRKLEGTDSRTYDQLCSAAFLRDINALYGAFSAASGSDSHPYNLLSQGLTTYSYPRLTALEHYGDWQAQFESDALVYYEAYSDGTYGFFGGNADSLSDTRTIVGDGYAVALSQPPASDWRLTVSRGTVSTTLTAASPCYTTTYSGETYYLFPLPLGLAAAPSGTGAAFLQAISVGDRTYYYNPYFAKTVATGAGTPDTVFLRSARHLYSLSRYYGSYADATAASTFLQERDIDYTTYRWTTYTDAASAVTQQAPITGADGFLATYDGEGHTITGVSFAGSARGSVGMFATISRSGRVQNTILLAGSDEAVLLRGQIDGSTVQTYVGVLAGRNYGTISRCAVSGYGFVGPSGNRSFGLTAYNHSTVYVGGLVGANFASGTSRSGSLGIFSSEANCPSMIVSAYNASVYAGGLAGSNRGGTIQASYALGSLYAKDVSSSTVQLGGFTGDNSGGVLRYCYSATALTAAGEAEVYGLTRLGGSAMSCYYLNGGTYAYEDTLYAYNTSANSFSVNAAGSPITGAELERLRLPGFSPAVHTVYDGTDSYPYPAVVRNDASQVTHYGDWPTLEHIGTLGVFYWEYESGGSSGYHLSYVGTDDGTPISDSSLCTQHNDGGTVTRYGYGYFYKSSTITAATGIRWQHDGCVIGDRRSEVESALAAQMKGYSFVAYETGPAAGADGSMYLTGASANSTWTLQYDGNTYTYAVCPFFADAITLVSSRIGGMTQYTDAAQPGDTEDSAYRIRSVSQLQNINWNYGTRSSTHALLQADDANIVKYPYLGSYRDSVTSGSNFTNTTSRFWTQTHDVDAAAEGIGSTDADPFTPIGSMVDKAHVDNGANSQPYVAYFASNYNGGAYTIRNIQIRSAAQCVGLFGFTVGAELKDIILYSDRGSEVVNDASGTHWYAVGGLVGFAGAGKNGASFTNCSVSGYTIRDQRANNPGWGGGCVGGLVGATNMNITGCTAVTDIVINISYDMSYRNLRVGGIAGVCRATLDKCYAGGAIKAMDMVKNYGSPSSSTNIWVGGLVGGVILRDQGALETTMGTTSNPLTVQNCYSFVELPASGNRKTHVVSSYAIASNGEMSHTFSITYNNNGIRYTIPNPHAIIKNSYCLISAVSNTDDYKAYRNLSDRDWQNGKNINTRSTENARRIVLTNDRSPYISYDDMEDPAKLAAWLNGGASATSQTFDFVTVEENGARIDGKYSFPGADAQRLDGLNYPFPTILTQQDVFGRTVSVHYGAWPMHGLYWERSSAVLDLFADRQGSGQLPALTIRLYPEGSAVPTGQTPVITLWNEDGSEAGDLLIGSTQVTQYNAAEGCWEVTFTASGSGSEGLVIARATQGTFTADLTIQVGAVLSLTSDKGNGLTVRYGDDAQTVTLSLRDSHDRPITADASQGQRLDWSITAETLADGTAIVEWDPIRTAPGASGDYLLDVRGFAAGDAAITVTCTYSYPENGTQRSITASTIISARSIRDAVGLVYDVTEDTALRTFANGVYLPYTGASGGDGGSVDVPDFERESGALYLFAGNGYTDLGDFTVDVSGLIAVDNGGQAVSEGWTVTLGPVAEGDDCRWRRLTTDIAVPRRLYLSGTIVLTRDGQTYRLALTNYPCGADPAP